MLSATRPLAFHAYSPLLKVAVDNPLTWLIDWTKVSSGYYALADPVGSGSILYYSEKEYRSFLKTALSNDVAIVVLAVPGDSKPHDSAMKTPKPQTSPPGAFLAPPGRLTELFSSLGRWLFGGVVSKDSTVKPTERNLWGLVVRWGRILGQRAGFRRGLTTVTNVLVPINKFLTKTARDHGARGVILCLKVSLLTVNKYLCKTPVSSTYHLGFPMRLSCGLPTWIPLVVRHAIRERHPGWIRFICSLLYIYRIIDGPRDFLKTISGVLRPPLELTQERKALLGDFEEYLFKYFVPNLGGVRKLPNPNPKSYSEQSQPVVSTNAGPNFSKAILSWDLDAIALSRDLRLCKLVKQLLSYHEDQFYLGVLNSLLESINRDDPLIETARNACIKKEGGRLRPLRLPSQTTAIHSKLSALEEPAGKIRIIAILDAFTQGALRPLHDDLFAVLKKFPQDGTFSQDGLIQQLRMIQQSDTTLRWASLDLSAATDSIPRVLYELVLKHLYGSELYAQTVLAVMTDRDFKSPRNPALARLSRSNKGRRPSKMTFKLKRLLKLEAAGIPDTIRYGRGQPMGAYASFALLALVHHAIVGYCAWTLNKQPYTTYGVVGDDVVLAEGDYDIIDGQAPIAHKYLDFCKTLEIGISLPKSFTGINFFNFLSRTFMGDLEVSPLSVKEEVSSVGIQGRLNSVARCLQRGWLDLNNKRWLTSAIRMMCNCNEYQEFTHWYRSGYLSPLVARLTSSMFAPMSPLSKELGLQDLSFTSWLAALRSQTTIFDLTYRHSRSVDSHIGYSTYVELLSFVLEFIQASYDNHCVGSQTFHIHRVRYAEQCRGYLATVVQRIDKAGRYPRVTWHPLDPEEKTPEILEQTIKSLVTFYQQLPPKLANFSLGHEVWTSPVNVPTVETLDLLNQGTLAAFAHLHTQATKADNQQTSSHPGEVGDSSELSQDGARFRHIKSYFPTPKCFAFKPVKAFAVPSQH